MREIKISLETATRWYNGTDTELRELSLQTYPELVKKELPKTWKGLGMISGFFVDNNSNIIIDRGSAIERNSNFFATKQQAEASIAIAQISQLIAVYNDGWVADYNNCNRKYIIYYNKEKLIITDVFSGRAFLTFKDRKTAELFLENFKDLILTAKPLL